MKITIELDANDLKELVLRELNDKLRKIEITIDNVGMEATSYHSAEWEVELLSGLGFPK